MTRFRTASTFLMVLVVVPVGYAQLPEQDTTIAIPTKPFPTYAPEQASLSNLWVARIDVDRVTLKLSKPKFRVEASSETILVPKTTYRPEIRSRKKEGSDENETFSVNVPTTTEEELAQLKSIPDGVEQYTVSTLEAKAWKIDGTPLTNDQLANLLSTPRQVFVSQFIADDFPGLDPYFRSVLRSETIFIRVPTTFYSDSKYCQVTTNDK